MHAQHTKAHSHRQPQTTHQHQYAARLHKRAVRRDTQLYKFMQTNEHEKRDTLGRSIVHFEAMFFLGQQNIGVALSILFIYFFSSPQMHWLFVSSFCSYLRI